MANKLFASLLATALSLGSATPYAAPTGHEARDQVSPAKVQGDEGKTRYWSHPRLGMVKVDAGGRMLTPPQPRMTLHDPQPLPGILLPAHVDAVRQVARDASALGNADGL